VSLPPAILEHIYHHYQAAEWGIITLDENNQICHINPKASKDLDIPFGAVDIQSSLPLLATEALDRPFLIPFYNHGKQVFDVHFLLAEGLKFLILIPIDQVHKQVQEKQQLAHEQAIKKERLQWLFATLEAAHEELQAANSAKSFYISALSHEMGNPLNAIKGYNELLMAGDIETSQATAIINKNVSKLEHIISQTLDYDQQNAGGGQQPIKPADLVEELLVDFKLQANRKGLRLCNEVDQALMLKTQPNKVQQILSNLLSNAIKYTPSGSVTVQSSTAPNEVHFDVIDTGSGMSEAFQRKLFTAWSREGKSDSQGNGIGLVICKMLAEQLGGQLTLRSSTPAGSAFRLTLPHHSGLNSKRILLVDDDVDCLNLFAFYLRQAGHHVTAAESLTELVQLASESHFDTLITDLNLADGQADEALDQLQTQFKQTVLMSAHPSQARIEQMLAAGFDRVLVKPLSQEDLVNCVSE